MERSRAGRPRVIDALGKVVRLLRRDLQIEIAQGVDGENSLRRRFVAEVEAEFGTIDGFLPVRIEVHFEDNVGAGFDQLRAILQPRHRGVARLVAQQQVTPGEDRFTITLPAALSDSRNEDLVAGETGQVAGTGLADERIHVVDDGALVDAELGGAHPGIALDVNGDNQECVGLHAGFRDAQAGHLDDHIRFAEAPLIVRRGDGHRLVGRAFGAAGFHPPDEGLDLRPGEGAIIPELMRTLRGVPWRHGTGDNRLANRAGPRPDLRVTGERHRCYRARLVTGDTARFQHGTDIAREGRRFGGGTKCGKQYKAGESWNGHDVLTIRHCK